MKKLLNDEWKFALFAPDLGVDYDCLKNPEKSYIWQEFAPVDLPHDWMIYDTGNLYRSSIGLYKRTLRLNAAKKNFLYFEGVYMNTTVYLNGMKVKFWPYGYSSFEVDLSQAAKDGENELLVCVEYREPNTRWYSGAGIFRDVWFYEKEEVRLVTDGIYFSAEEQDGKWKACVDTELIGSCDTSSAAEARLVTYVLDGDRVLASVCSDHIRIYREAAVHTDFFELSNIRKWSTEDPYLYTLRSELYDHGVCVDSCEQKIGFRTLRFDPDEGFSLNGRHIKIHGACMHHDLGALGAAFNECALRRQFRELKKMGINAVRTSHNMPAVTFMKVADEMGMLVDSEAFDMWEMKKTANDYGVYFHDYCERDTESWIRRDRNHPSVIMWSVGNEIPDTNNAGSEAIAIRLRDAVRRNDYRHNAFTTIGSNFVAWGEAWKSSDVLEVSGYNYLEHVYDEHHASKFPHWVIYGSETASTVQSRGIYHFPQSNCLLTYEDMQCSCLDNCHTNWGAKSVHKVICDDRDRDYCAGQFIWTGWDYIGEPTPYFSKNSFFGHIDTAGFWKDTAYIFRAAWTDYRESPFVHIAPYWDFNPGQMIDIDVYSNCPKIALYKDETLVGEQELNQKKDLYFSGHWQLPYAEGRLVAIAFDENGREAARQEITSFGEACAISVHGESNAIAADGESINFITIEMVDQNGRVVENARNRVQVMVDGPGRLIGMDNGDSTDYDQYKCNSRKLFSGKLLAMVASTKEAGRVFVTVSSKGMESVVYEFDTIPAEARPGSSCTYHIPGSHVSDVVSDEMRKQTEERMQEVPIRKLKIICEENRLLTPDHREVHLKAVVEPEYATYDDIQWKAATLEGIPSNAVTIEASGREAVLRAVGDGEFSLILSAANGKDHTEVMSVLEFRAEGLGTPFLNPYDEIHACQYAACNYDALLSFRGGVNLTEDNTVITFDHIDFGEYGSDELAFYIYSWRNREPVEIWSGVPDEGELLFSGDYEIEPIYNVYQENVFHLKRRLKGCGSITFRFYSGFVFGGFHMLYQEKTYGLLYATEHNMITGDSYEEREEGIYGIGNNVDIEFLHMNLNKGLKGIEITGRSHIPSNPVHIRFKGENGDCNQLCDFTESEEIVTRYFELADVRGENKLNIIFLPGSAFDLISFRLIALDE